MSEWTLDSLKENLENEISAVRLQMHDLDIRYNQRFEAQEKATSTAMASSKEAVSKAEASTEKRFDSVNEFRGALSDQAAQMMSRNEYATAHQSLADKIDALTVRIAATEGQAHGSRLTMGNLVTAFSVAIAVITVLVLYLKP